MKLLHVDSSILGAASASRALTASIVERQKALHPGLEVIYRDLAATSPLHLSPTHLAAWQGTAPDDAAVRQDVDAGGALLDELFAADIVVIGVPMYNFGVPSQLKAWIDRLLIAGKTFRYTDTGPEGLVIGKKIFIASTRGGVYAPGTPVAALEHQETWLRGALGFIGMTDVTVIRAEGLAMGPDAREAAMRAAGDEIAALAA